MLLFGHLGISIGAGYLVERKFKVKIDYRLLALGALLPDIIDKPLGLIILPIHNGRIYAHTLLFLFILTAISLKIEKLQYVALGDALHLLEDRMWMQPSTLFWPLLGNFPSGKISFGSFIQMILSEYTPSLNYTFVSEAVGFCILVAFIYHRFKSKSQL